MKLNWKGTPEAYLIHSRYKWVLTLQILQTKSFGHVYSSDVRLSISIFLQYESAPTELHYLLLPTQLQTLLPDELGMSWVQQFYKTLVFMTAWTSEHFLAKSNQIALLTIKGEKIISARFLKALRFATRL